MKGKSKTAPEPPLASTNEIAAAFPPALTAMLRTGKATGETRMIDFVGGSTLNNLYSLHRLFMLTDARRTLEVGLACGTSALLLAALHKERGAEGCGQHVALDPFQHELDNAGVTQLAAEGLSEYVRLLREPSHVALPELLQAGEQFDLAYIDGSHLFENVVIDFFYGIRLLRPGGYIAFDDSTWADVRKLLRFVRRNFKDSLLEIDVLDLRPHETVSLKHRMAAKIGRVQLSVFQKTRDPVRPWSAHLIDF